jgi:hypothetical protein
MDDDHPWGTEELNPAKFFIVTWPHRPAHSFKHWLDEGTEQDPEQRSRRKWRIDPADGKAYDRETGNPDPENPQGNQGGPPGQG